MNILKFPNPILFQKCKEVEVFDAELKILLESMWDTMVNSNGIGLAANQVGLNLRMFTMVGPNDDKLFFINPKIVSRSLVSANLEEGCLSSPGEFLILSERSLWIKVQYQDETGTDKERVFHGIYSVCAQHEIDHLNGESYLQSKSIPRAKRKELAKRWGIKLK